MKVFEVYGEAAFVKKGEISKPSDQAGGKPTL